MQDRIGQTKELPLCPDPDDEGNALPLTDTQCTDVLTTLQAQGVDDAESLQSVLFYTNDFDTTTQGVDIVATYPMEIAGGDTVFTFAGNWNQTQVTEFNPDVISLKRVIQLEENLPNFRFTLTGDHMQGPWRFLTRLHYYDDFVEFHVNDDTLRIDAAERWLVDLEASYTFKAGLTIASGAQNLFDTFPTKIPMPVERVQSTRRRLPMDSTADSTTSGRCMPSDRRHSVLVTTHQPLEGDIQEETLFEEERFQFKNPLTSRGVMTMQLVQPISIGVLILTLSLGFPLTSRANEAQTFYNQGLTHLHQQEFSQSAQSLQEALKVFPNFAAAHHLLGVVLFTGLQQPQQAVTHLKEAVALHPNFAQAYLDLGLVYQHQKDLEHAKEAIRKALEIYPHFSEAQLNLAFVHDQLGEQEDAISAYQATLTLNPEQTTAMYNLATLYDRHGDEVQAREQLQALTKLAPQDTEAWLLLAQLAEKDNHEKEAIQAYQTALQLNADLLEAHYALGFLLQGQDQTSQAATHFQEVLRLNPNHAEAHLNLGVLFANLAKLDQAEQEYLKALGLNPNLVEGYYNLGVFYEFHRKDTTRALAQYRQYVELGGKDERVRNLLKKTGS